MELESKLIDEAIALANKLEIMEKKSDDYKTTLDRYQTVVKLLSEETKRINSTQQMELEAKKLAIEQDRIELEGQRARLNASIEEEKLVQQKKSNWWQAGLKVLGGVVTVFANLATVYVMIRMNNSGETLTSFENKFIFPDRLK